MLFSCLKEYTMKNSTGNMSELPDISILKCMQCGICSGSCPSGRFMELNIRTLIKKSASGRPVLDEDELWMCTTCYSCQERCPRQIKIVDWLLSVRSKAVHEGNIKPEHKQVIKNLLDTGHAVPINQENIEKRERLGLNSLPSTVVKDDGALKDVKNLLKSCGFDTIITEDQI